MRQLGENARSPAVLRGWEGWNSPDVRQADGTFGAGGGAVLGGSRRRLDGIGLGYLFLGASHFKYHAGTAAKLVLADWASTPAGKPAFVGLVAAAAGSGDAWAGFWPASAGAAWPAAGGHLRRAAGLIAAAEATMPRRAAPALSIGVGNRDRSGLEE
jgi:hypothetical protein